MKSRSRTIQNSPESEKYEGNLENDLYGAYWRLDNSTWKYEKTFTYYYNISTYKW